MQGYVKKIKNSQAEFNTNMQGGINIRKFINIILHLNRPKVNIHHHICPEGL